VGTILQYLHHNMPSTNFDRQCQVFYQNSDQYQGNVQLTIIADTQQIMPGTLWISARHW